VGVEVASEEDAGLALGFGKKMQYLVCKKLLLIRLGPE